MKLVLFESGQAGEVKTLPGEYPMEEIGELLGSEDQEPDMIQLTDKLWLCVAGEGDTYAYLPQGWKIPKLTGPCAVVRVGADGNLRDVTREDVEEANERVWPVEEG